MLPDRVSNPGPLTYESGALPIALRGPAVYNFGLSECNRVKVIHTEFSMTVLFLNGLLYEFL